MAYFSDNFMGHRREQWLRSIHAVEAQVGTTWHRGTINKTRIEGDTLVILATFPTLDSVECTISASRLIDVRGEVAAYQQRLVKKVAGQGVMVKLTIPIYEVTA